MHVGGKCGFNSIQLKTEIIRRQTTPRSQKNSHRTLTVLIWGPANEQKKSDLHACRLHVSDPICSFLSSGIAWGCLLDARRRRYAAAVMDNVPCTSVAAATLTLPRDPRTVVGVERFGMACPVCPFLSSARCSRPPGRSAAPVYEKASGIPSSSSCPPAWLSAAESSFSVYRLPDAVQSTARRYSWLVTEIASRSSANRSQSGRFFLIFCIFPSDYHLGYILFAKVLVVGCWWVADYQVGGCNWQIALWQLHRQWDRYLR